MAPAVSPNQDAIYLALWTFLTGIMPVGFPVLKGQVNRVPEPPNTNFAVMTFMRQERIETNVDTVSDVVFTASIAGTVMTVSDVRIGTIDVGAQVFGTGLAGGTATQVVALLSGTGGAGTYTVTPSQIAASQQMAAGGQTFLQPTKLTIQVDVHGPDGANNAQVISTLMRDPYAVERFAELNEDVIPLYADDPKQTPFLNENQQYEDRWTVEVMLQANQTVAGIPQQFAGSLVVDLVAADDLP